MKKLPWILALLNVVFTFVVFMYAIMNPEKNGLLPILVYFVDVPASFGAERLRDLLHDHFSLVTRLTIDCLIYMLVGFVWLSRRRTRSRLYRSVEVNGNQQQGESHDFDLVPETAFWSPRPCNQGRCAITCIHSERLNAATNTQCRSLTTSPASANPR